MFSKDFRQKHRYEIKDFYMRSKILVIDDDPTLQMIAQQSLKGFEVVQAANVAEAKQAIEQFQFYAILVDIELPDGDGLRLLSEMKAKDEFKNVPVFILSGRTDIQNKIMAFSVGADDYITKPFDPLELYARVNARVTKARQEMTALKQKIIGNLLVDLDRQSAYFYENGTERDLTLTSTEFKILVMLTYRLQQVYSREQILDRVWGNTHISDRTVDSHVAHLRSKLKGTSVVVDTVKNFGFRAIAA
jgi:DNA-binding response OmpR family regulator